MRILYLAPEPISVSGRGDAVRVFETLRNLNMFKDVSLDVLVPFVDPPYEQHLGGINFIYSPMLEKIYRKRRYIYGSRQSIYTEIAYRIAKKENADIIYAFRNPISTLVASLVPRSKIPYRVGEWHTLTPAIDTPKAMIPMITNKVLTKCDRFSSKRLDLMFPIYDALEQYLINLGVPQDKIVKFPLGTNVSHFSNYSESDSNDVREAFGVSDDDFILGFTGSLNESHSDVMCVLTAIEMLLHQLPNLKFLIIGDGSSKHIISKAISNKGLKRQVKMIGAIDYLSLPKYFTLMDAVVAPYKDTLFTSVLEAPTKILDYLAAKKPVIISDVGNISKTFKPYEDAIFVKTGSATDIEEKILELYNSPGLRSKISEKGHIKIKREYNIQQIIHELYSQLKSLVEE